MRFQIQERFFGFGLGEGGGKEVIEFQDVLHPMLEISAERAGNWDT